ncbi:conserved hypothetical protein [uncultured Paludibacter sp.]|nr:conserved hypothetical protein [uncultured Paludibacter sp.]
MQIKLADYKKKFMNKIWQNFFMACTFILMFQVVDAQQINRTEILNNNIKTLRVKVNEDALNLPIIKLGSDDVMEISFDELSHEIHSYSYNVQHCNADWTLSNLSSNEYIDGFTNAQIENYNTSINTTVLYTHYDFSLPNNQMNFKISGNYVVNIYQDNNSENPIAKLCFSVVDPKVEINAKIRGNTDTELSGALQQIDFDVLLQGYYVQNPQSDIKIVVRQNNRIDNEVTNIKPTFFNSNTLTYNNNRNLIFEGGNEYHRFDISSVYNYSEKINTIKFVSPNYQAYLFEDEINRNKTYVQDFDVNGRFIINYQNHSDDDITADYLYVNFYLKKDEPFLEGNVYIGGEYNYNQLNDINRMEYDFNSGMYFKKILLKQGGYNYQYWLKSKGDKKATTTPIDGSFWQTQNEYTIYVYHRGFGDRYDKLIGVKTL